MSSPLSRIILYKAPEFSPSYKDTLNFADRTSQANYFNALPKKTLNPVQFTRITNNQIKVPFPVEEIRTYNYMSIQNRQFTETTEPPTPTGKIFYCFITNVEYVADLCSLITFKVDVIQTFFLDALFGECFVERTHTNTDIIFDNREPEEFTVFDYTTDVQGFYSVNTPYVVIGIVEGTELTINGLPHTCQANSYLSGRVYSGAEYFIFDITDATERTTLESILNEIKATPSVVTDFYCVPRSSYNGTTGGSVSGSIDGGTRNITPTTLYTNLEPTVGTALSGYTPVNKKLYNSPFTYLRVRASTGKFVDLKFEEFIKSTAYPVMTFIERGNWFQNGECALLPINYNATLFRGNKDYELILGDFPHCSWASDSFAEWKAQKLGGQLAALAIDTLSAGVMIALADSAPVGSGYGSAALGIGQSSKVLSDVSGLAKDAIQASKKPNTFYPAQTSSTLQLSQNLMGWYFERMSLSAPEAKQIDDYFTMFGYAQNKIMNPKNHIIGSLRPKFCYIKTVGMGVRGNIPSDYKDEINAIFDNGITFWKPTAIVGDYSGNTV